MTQNAEPLTLKCPVCQARFRGQPVCSRCSTDLSMLMRISARAWAARQRARVALRGGDLSSALRWHAIARQLHDVKT